MDYGIWIGRMPMDSDKVDVEGDVVETRGVMWETHYLTFLIDDLERLKAETRVGYLSMNLYEPPAEASWGVYNDRKIQEEWVEELFNDFQRRYDNCTEEDCLEIAIKLEWLRNRDRVSDNEIYGMV
jgi:hypothetical protein